MHSKCVLFVICQLYINKAKKIYPLKSFIHPSKFISGEGPFPVPTPLLSAASLPSPRIHHEVLYLTFYILLPTLVIFVPFLSIRLNSFDSCKCVKRSRFNSIPARWLTFVFFYLFSDKEEKNGIPAHSGVHCA